MKVPRNPALLPLLLVLGLLAAACGNGDAGSVAEPEGTDPPQAEEVPGLVQPGTLTLVTTGNFPPFTMTDESTGEVLGYSIDIGREVADRLGLGLDLPTVDFVAELQGLAAGRYDLANSGIQPTDERRQEFLFTNPLGSTGMIATIRPEDEGRISGVDNLEGLRVGAVQGSLREQWAVENEAELGYDSYSGFPGAAQALTALQTGRIDVILDDPLVTFYYMAENPGEVSVAGSIAQQRPTAMALNIENEALQTVVNEVIDEMREDGTLARIQTEWFGRCLETPTSIDNPQFELPPGDCEE